MPGRAEGDRRAAVLTALEALPEEAFRHLLVGLVGVSRNSSCNGGFTPAAREGFKRLEDAGTAYFPKG